MASSSTATASAKPSIFITTKPPSMNEANTAIITAAAFVITGPVCATPSTIAAVSSRPA